jgi:HSP20 family molecular chaperone IbpA
MTTEQALSTTENQALTTESTHDGDLISPVVDIFESETSITLLADMPGVAADNLKVDLNEGVLTISGHVSDSESKGAVDVLREYRAGTFQRKFSLSETVNQEKIEARLTDGVLRLELPKIDRAKPRRIEVKAS